MELVKIQLQQQKDLDRLAYSIAKQTHFRLTLVEDNGLVLAESHEDKSTMDSHLNREEILQTATHTYGSSIRYSNTLNEDFLYMATRITYENRPVYLRMAVSLKKLLSDFHKIWIQIALIFALAVIIGFIVAFRMSKRIQKDVDTLNFYLEQVEKKNYKAPLYVGASYEFVNIAFTLKSVINKLDRREKQRRKYTAKLRLINKQRNDILSALSHEFKNPLAAIIGYAQTLQNETPSEQTHAVFSKFLDKIVQNSQKITHMLDRLALSVKLENNDLTPQLGVFDLGIVCQDAVQTILKKAPQRTVEFTYVPCMVHMDRAMIEMVLINLLDNALKYSTKKITLTLDEKRVYVIDEGIGIEEEDIKKISAKFYRVDKNSWDNSMGLGLAIVSYILHLHQSKLEIQSHIGMGSTFSFKYTHA